MLRSHAKASLMAHRGIGTKTADDILDRLGRSILPAATPPDDMLDRLGQTLPPAAAPPDAAATHMPTAATTSSRNAFLRRYCEAKRPSVERLITKLDTDVDRYAQVSHEAVS
jgi:hypothetical protein